MWPFSPPHEGPIRAPGQSPGVPPKRKAFGIRLLAAALVAGAVAAIAFGLDLDGDARPARAADAHALAASTSGGCGAATAMTVAAVQSAVARRIYAEEATGASTRLDSARVASFPPLLHALESGAPGAVRTAVHQLVYMPGWHIVRLRVVRGGHVLADIGGPYILAPVRGTLRAHGRVLADYVMSVQDDLGYVKLVTRFIGAPIDIFWNGSRVMGTGGAAAAQGEQSSTLSLGAFPAGRLEARLYVAQPPSSASCAAVRTAAWGSVARHVAARFHPLSAHLNDLADVVRTVTGGRLFVRAGARHIAGGGPPRLPRSGSVRYEGRRWSVYSWQPLPNVRAVLLAPQ